MTTENAPKKPRYMRVSEMAERLNVSRHAAYRIIDDPDLQVRSIRPPFGRIQVRTDDVERLAEEIERDAAE